MLTTDLMGEEISPLRTIPTSMWKMRWMDRHKLGDKESIERHWEKGRSQQ
jgi:hypothetical protein